MRYIIIAGEETFAYLQHIFEKHCAGGVSRDELAIAGQLDACISRAQVFDETALRAQLKPTPMGLSVEMIPTTPESELNEPG